MIEGSSYNFSPLRRFRVEELCEFRFKARIDGVVAGGAARGGHGEAVGLQGGGHGGGHIGMAGEAEVVAAGEAGELAPTEEHVSAVNLL